MTYFGSSQVPVRTSDLSDLCHLWRYVPDVSTDPLNGPSSREILVAILLQVICRFTTPLEVVGSKGELCSLTACGRLST